MLTKNPERECPETTGTFSFDETSSSEQTVVTITITSRKRIGGFHFDMSNVTQDTTIKIKHQIDGTNYRTLQTIKWGSGGDDGVYVEGFKAYRNVRVTFTCGGGGAGSVNVPYAIV